MDTREDGARNQQQQVRIVQLSKSFPTQAMKRQSLGQYGGVCLAGLPHSLPEHRLKKGGQVFHSFARDYIRGKCTGRRADAAAPHVEGLRQYVMMVLVLQSCPSVSWRARLMGTLLVANIQACCCGRLSKSEFNGNARCSKAAPCRLYPSASLLIPSPERRVAVFPHIQSNAWVSCSVSDTVDARRSPDTAVAVASAPAPRSLAPRCTTPYGLTLDNHISRPTPSAVGQRGPEEDEEQCAEEGAHY